MRLSVVRLSVVGLLVVVGPAVSGCPAPCEAQADCPELSYCNDDGVCQTDCTTSQECADNQTCGFDGRCQVGSRPNVRFISPPPGTVIDGPFDVEVEVEFVGSSATLTLDLADGDQSACGAFFPDATIITGENLVATTQTVRFSDVRVSGASPTLRAEATTELAADNPGSALLDLSGTGDGQLAGVSVVHPVQTTVDDDAVSTAVEVAFGRDVGDIWATVVPFAGSPGPMRLLGQGTRTDDGARVTLARGRQLLHLKTAQGDCDVPVDVPAAGFGGLEAGLGFFSSAPTELKLAIYVERDDGSQAVCDAASGGFACGSFGGSQGVTTAGGKWARFDAEDGVYGIAAIPGAVAPQVRAELRLSRDDAHIEFLGPRLMNPNTGEIWLAARLYVIDGRLTIERMDRLVTEAPPSLPSAW